MGEQNKDKNYSSVWAEIDLAAVAHNIKQLRTITNHNAVLMAVVKANGYGHGVVKVAGEALKNGAGVLGVARLEEGIELRKNGFDSPVLIFGYTSPSIADKLIENDLTQTVWSLKTAEELSSKAVLYGRKIKIHIKVDTGMGRLGLLPDCLRPIPGNGKYETSAKNEVASIALLSGLELEGIYTHFATAGSRDKSYAKKQFEIFSDFMDELHKEKIEISLRHAANSAAIIDMPETHLDMVRAGISIYGLYPSGEVNRKLLTLQPAMSLKSRVVHLKKVSSGFKVSYGCTFRTQQPTTIASVPIGYADGFSRLLSSKGWMLVKGCRAPIAGRVCMDQVMLDVGHIPDVALEDEVVIIGKQGDEFISADEIASTANTINYEVVSSLTSRVRRIYFS